MYIIHKTMGIFPNKLILNIPKIKLSAPAITKITASGKIIIDRSKLINFHYINYNIRPFYIIVYQRGRENSLQKFLISSLTFFTDLGLEITSFIQPAIVFISFSFMPRVVIAGVPILIPEGLKGGAGS